MKREREGRSGPLASVAAIDISSGLAASFCAKILADLGASVLKIEPPGEGDPRRGPGNSEAPDPEFLYANSSKQSIQLDIESQQGLQILGELLATYDILIASGTRARMTGLGLDHAALSAVNPRAILVTVSAFGSDGPYSDWSATPLIVNAMGGWANSCGLADREPLLAAGNLSEFVSGGYAAAATIAAVNQRDVTGVGQWVDVSGMESVLTAALLPTLVWEYAGTLQIRNGSRSTGPSWMLECNDGYVGANVLTPPQWQGLCQLVEAWDLLDDPDYQRPGDRMAREPELRARFEPWFRERSAAEVFHEAQTRRLPFGLVPTFRNILEFEQHAARDFFVEFPHPQDPARTYKFPGLPFRMSATPASPTPPPEPGEHTDEILRDLLSLSSEQIVELRLDGVVGPGGKEE